MPFPTKCLAYRGPDAKHEYHPTSGWCIHGCGNRDDGRLVWMTGGTVVNPGPEYTPEQLANLAHHIAEETHHAAQPTLDLPA
jgi:hypothetical protein